VTLIAGIGNILLGDDGLGPEVIRYLQQNCKLPVGVTAVDLGTPGIDLAPHLSQCERLILIDAVDDTGAPGEIRVYRGDDLFRRPAAPRLSPHDPGLQETLLYLELAGSAPGEVTLIGAIAGATEPGVGLSDEVRAAVPALARQALAMAGAELEAEALRCV
jgi:hydrogenase maturation protease